MKRAPEPDKFLEPEKGSTLPPFMLEKTLWQLMKWRDDYKLPTLYTDLTSKDLQVGTYAYLPFTIKDGSKEENVCYYGKCIHVTKSQARFHLLDCSTFSEYDNEAFHADISVAKLEHIIKIEHPIPQPTTQNNKELIEKTETDHKKTIALIKTVERQMNELKTDVKTQFTQLQLNVKASNITANKTLGTMLERSLPPPPTKVKVSQIANPTLECTITNVPYKKDENLNDMIMKISKKKDLNITPTDFHAFRAIKKNDNIKRKNPPRIIIAFRTNDMKNEFKKRHDNDPKQEDFDTTIPKENQQIIYINENISREQQQLSYSARMFKRECNYDYVWTRDGVLFVRKDENSHVHTIKSQTDLDNLKEEHLADQDEEDDEPNEEDV
jgi:hypothetical protein